MDTPSAYIPIDRRHALARGEDLPERTTGATLFADISGFTPLQETLALELGARRGAEELTIHLNNVYNALSAAITYFVKSLPLLEGRALIDTRLNLGEVLELAGRPGYFRYPSTLQSFE